VKSLHKVANAVLIVLILFLALTATLGGLAIVTGINAPNTTELTNSVFKGSLIPGIALFLIVGGSATLAVVLLLRKSRFGVLFATVAGIVIMFFEFVEVLVIGSPAGVARTLQIFYYGLGTLITIVSIGMWFIDLLFEPR